MRVNRFNDLPDRVVELLQENGQLLALANAADTATYVALILDHQVEPLSASFLQSRQQAALDDWLAQRRKPEFYFTWNDRVPVIPVPTPPPSSTPLTGP